MSNKAACWSSWIWTSGI